MCIAGSNFFVLWKCKCCIIIILLIVYVVKSIFNEKWTTGNILIQDDMYK